jgi:glycosyltransferase involved in cell wall biosynthesis
MTITVAGLNPVEIRDGVLRVDRKFHSGMMNYCQSLPGIVALNPKPMPGQPIMDAVEVKLTELPYTVEVVESTGDPWQAAPHEWDRLRAIVRRARLVYGCSLSVPQIARELGVPYILVLEFDLQTKLTILRVEAGDLLRRFVRQARCLRDHRLFEIPITRAARLVQCNGYPIYDQTARHNGSRLLYFDSRMSQGQVISSEALRVRLADRKGPLRLLYSGRYEKIKGADDAVRLAIECLRRGMDIELDCYGEGCLKERMQSIAGTWPQIRIHDSVPFPELVEIARKSDVFVCCHVQSDPSCTYVESMGAGLPIVGYGNRMWKRMCEESKAGTVSKIGDVSDIAAYVSRLLEDQSMLARMSENARRFALEHCFEREFDKRVRAITEELSQPSPDSTPRI